MRRFVTRSRFTALAAMPVLALAACGSSEEETPSACLGEASSYARALRGAPARAELAEGVPISSCLTTNQGAGELTRVGAAMLGAATALNAEARGGDGGAALRLGYLIGAASRGAAETSGIHTNLVERLQAAAEFGPGDAGLPPAAAAAYARGVAAGRDRG